MSDARQKVLQNQLNVLLEDCGKDYKISGGTIKKIVPPKENLLLSVDATKNIRYVGEVGWLRDSMEGTFKINEIWDDLKKNNPDKIIFESGGVVYMDDTKLDKKYHLPWGELDNDDCIFEKCDDGSYTLNVEESGINVDEHEDYCLSYIGEILILATTDKVSYKKERYTD